jgi:hypothetical protein
MTRRSTSFPRTKDQLRAWLKQTNDGKAILGALAEEALESRCRECQFALEHPTRPKVLVVVRRLERVFGVQVFQEKGVNLRVEEMLDTMDDPTLETLCEEELVSRLPVSWKGLVLGTVGAKVGYSGVTAERRLRSLRELEWLRELKAFQKDMLGAKQ